VQSEKEHLILVRCSDGRIKVPNEFNNYTVHPISLPGGPIAPELSSVTNDDGEKTLEVLMWFIETMVNIKLPTRIVLVAHSHCAAGGMVGYNDSQLEDACMRFALILGKRFPKTRVTVFFDQHSECGQYREPPRFKDSTIDKFAALT
jgi:hypothetical protein